MYPITEEMKALFDEKQRQTVNITVELKDGSTSDDFNITEADIVYGSLSVDRYCATGENVEIGSAVSAEIRFTLDNTEGKFNGISLGGAKLFVRLGIKDWRDTHSAMSYMNCGYFTVDENPKPLTHISVAALDNMMRFDRAVNWNNFLFPMSVEGIVSVCCADCDVTLSPSVVFAELPNGTYIVQNKPSTTDTTYRQLIQWVAEITGTCAFINWNGHLRFRWSESTPVEINSSNRYSSTTDESITITGIQITESEDKTYLYGEEGFVFNIEGNELIQNNQSDIVSNLGAVLCGFTYVPFECSCFPMPYLYPLDIVSFTDIKGNTFDTMVTAHVYTLNGTSSLKCAGESTQKNYSVSNPFTKREALIIKKLKERAETNMSRIEQETVDMNKALSNALGLYDTTVKHDDGSVTYYYHSKPTLEECAEGDVIFCLNAGGFGVCTTGWKEGEPVFDYGIDAKSGRAIWDYLTVTHKLSANLIEAGTLQSTNGKTRFDLDNAVFRSESNAEYNREFAVELRSGGQSFAVKDAEGNEIGTSSFSARGMSFEQSAPMYEEEQYIAKQKAEWEEKNSPVTWEEYSSSYPDAAKLLLFTWRTAHAVLGSLFAISMKSTIPGREGEIIITPEDIVFGDGRKVLKTTDSNKVLWTGEELMGQGTTIELDELISEQPSGIVLVFSFYNVANGTVTNYDWHSFFVPKFMATNLSSVGHHFIMSRAGFGNVADKYLRIYDNKIVGEANNTASGTASGISFNSNYFVLRYVIGV